MLQKQGHRSLRPNTPPKNLASWLYDQGSLTKRLVAASDGDFRVQVVRQGFARPRLPERNALDLPERRVAMIREVLLFGRGEPWVYARSIVPLTTLSGNYRFLRHLGSKPLGALLFKDPSMRRGPIELIHVTIAELEIPALSISALTMQNSGEQVWGRRSTFYLGGNPLQVSEIFLPSFTTTVA